MLFNSSEFALFLPVVFLVYWGLARRSLKTQNAFLLAASYLFYGWWDWRFLILLVASSLVDYSLGIAIAAEPPQSRRRRALLVASLAFNLGLLGVFKYFDFFIGSFAELLERFGMQANVRTLRLVLPVGISFYTFQSLSYTIDVYRNVLRPTRDAIAFLCFVAFFPQLVAGPIERATHLLPQFLRPREFDLLAAKDGLRQGLWGLFKKMVVADNLAPLVEQVYGQAQAQTAPAVWLATFYFALQIYCDFSGYSDIAIGSARLFGFDLMQNFAFPYFSRDVREFWRRWHISLSTWFRDYLYVPLGGNRKGRLAQARNLFLTFLVSGLWHGANWTFVTWGALHGLLQVAALGISSTRSPPGSATIRRFPAAVEAVKILGTFALITFTWVFFRADSLSHARELLGRPWTLQGFSMLAWIGTWYAIPVLAVEWLQRRRPHALEIAHWPAPARWAVYYTVIAAIWCFASETYEPFVYFQF